MAAWRKPVQEGAVQGASAESGDLSSTELSGCGESAGSAPAIERCSSARSRSARAVAAAGAPGSTSTAARSGPDEESRAATEAEMGSRRGLGKVLAIEGIDGSGQIEMVGRATAGDVHVGLRAAGVLVYSAGRLGERGALDGVTRHGVGMVEPDVGAPTRTGVLVEERTWKFDLAKVVEGDADRLLFLIALRIHGDDRAVGAVSHVITGASGGVEGAVASAGDDPVAHGETAVVGGDDLLGADVPGHLEQAVGETVELAASVVAPIDHRVFASIQPGLPPTIQQVEVEVDLVANDMEVAGRLERGEGVADAAFAQGVGGGAVMRVQDPVGCAQLRRLGSAVLAQDAEHATGADSAMLSRITDQAHGRPGLVTEPEELVEVAIGDGGGLIDDEDCSGVERAGLRVGVGEVPGKGLRLDAGFVTEMPSCLALDGRPQDPVAGRRPRRDGSTHRSRLSRSRPADSALGAVTARAEGGDETALLSGEVVVSAERLIESASRYDGGARSAAVGIGRGPAPVPKASQLS